MAKIKLNKTNVEKKCVDPGYYRDDELPGFCLKITEKGKKVYLVNTKIHSTRKNVTITIGPHGVFTAEQAREKAKIILRKLADGIDPNEEKRQEAEALDSEKRREMDQGRVTLQVVLDDYLQRKAKKLKPRTKYNYRCVVQANLKDWLDKPIVEISEEMISDRHSQLSDDSPGMADNTMRVVRALFRFAKYEYTQLRMHPVIVNNPVSRLSGENKWNKLPRRKTVIKLHQLKPWYDAVQSLTDNPTVRDYLTLLLFTGLRKAEAESLRWQNVDLLGRQITAVDTKNGVPLELPLPDNLYAMFLQRSKDPHRDPVWVFPGRGDEGHITDVSRTVERVIEQSGVTFTLHDLRRTFTTIADSLGIGNYTIKTLVNHKSSGDVTGGYVVADLERLRKPIQEISDYILQQVGEPTKPKKQNRNSNVIDIKNRA